MGDISLRSVRPRWAAGAICLVTVGSVFAPGADASAAVADEGTQLVAGNSGKCITVLNASTANGAELIQFPCDSTADNDRWRAAPMGDGTYHLVAPSSGKCVNVSGGSTANSVKVIQFTCSTTAKNDRWRFRPVSGKPTFQIVAEHSGKCLNVSGGASQDNAAIIQFTCGTTPGLNEQWYFPPTESPAPSSRPLPHDAPVVAIQGSSADGSAAAPLTYAFTDNGGRVRVGHQSDPNDGSSVQWSTISGLDAFSDTPALGVQADGRVEVVAQNAADGDVWLNTATAKGAPTFAGWQDVGGTLPSPPAAGRMPDGKLELFGLTGSALWNLPQDSVNTPYAAWRQIAAIRRIPEAQEHVAGMPVTAPTIDGMRLFVPWSNGTLDVVGIRPGAAPVWRSLDRAAPCPPPPACTPTSPCLASNTCPPEAMLDGRPAVVVYPGYRTRVFARTGTGAVVTKMETADGRFDPGWTAVGSLDAVGAPAAVMDPSTGRTVVLARDGDGQINVSTETAQGSGEFGAWSKPMDFVSVTDPTVVSYTGNRGDNWGYVVRNADGQVVLFTLAGLGGLRLSDSSPQFTKHQLPTPPK